MAQAASTRSIASASSATVAIIRKRAERAAATASDRRRPGRERGCPCFRATLSNPRVRRAVERQDTRGATRSVPRERRRRRCRDPEPRPGPGPAPARDRILRRAWRAANAQSRTRPLGNRTGLAASITAAVASTTCAPPRGSARAARSACPPPSPTLRGGHQRGRNRFGDEMFTVEQIAPSSFGPVASSRKRFTRGCWRLVSRRSTVTCQSMLASRVADEGAPHQALRRRNHVARPRAHARAAEGDQRAPESRDLRENAEYSAAKERQRFVEARVSMLRKRVSEIQLMNMDRIPKGRSASRWVKVDHPRERTSIKSTSSSCPKMPNPNVD